MSCHVEQPFTLENKNVNLAENIYTDDSYDEELFLAVEKHENFCSFRVRTTTASREAHGEVL